MMIRLVEEDEQYLWDELVRSCRSHYVDSTMWQAHLTGTFPNIAARRFVALQDGEPVSGMLLYETNSMLSGFRLTNAPFRLPTTFLGNNDDGKDALVAHIIAHARAARMDDVKLLLPVGTCSALMERHGLSVCELHYAPELPLHGSHESMRGRYKTLARRKIRRSAGSWRAGRYQFAIDETGACFDEFYEMLAEQSQRRHLTIPPPRRLVRQVWTRAHGGGNGDLFMIRSNNAMIAGAIILYHQGRAWYAWAALASGATVDRNAATCLLDGIIGTLCSGRRGVRSLDLGVVDAQNAGLAFFKSQWGATMLPHALYTLRLTGTPRSSGYDLLRGHRPLRRMVKYLPPSAVRMVSDRLYHQLV